ncbi:MAG: hypothetical protein A3B23_03220 [Candidatus Colwellbacteria bacterium RIFCSPLOWO2_01_FULL_48_10]|uniref:Uncharacterized protein n=2 Tax=Bacteria candidate phyla TaxID=1783234 RepID=A0A1F5NZA5_9BACT|nr:MAG: hypothetical protein A2846_02380 [Candidatus Doudnabacteria bacterium RIFCSPHIGHO2_01_FULL_49_9]OGY59661.1 MAG: hypothetical protein A3B23_03220 [Candidatus Colwellbacteria bacterium RIFCSPLOWO2_01_FULL_48_10]
MPTAVRPLLPEFQAVWAEWQRLKLLFDMIPVNGGPVPTIKDLANLVPGIIHGTDELYADLRELQAAVNEHPENPVTMAFELQKLAASGTPFDGGPILAR